MRIWFGMKDLLTFKYILQVLIKQGTPGTNVYDFAERTLYRIEKKLKTEAEKK